MRRLLNSPSRSEISVRPLSARIKDLRPVRSQTVSGTEPRFFFQRLRMRLSDMLIRLSVCRGFSFFWVEVGSDEGIEKGTRAGRTSLCLCYASTICGQFRKSAGRGPGDSFQADSATRAEAGRLSAGTLRPATL